MRVLPLRFRFTVRRMMFAVALIAVLLGVGIEAVRLKRYRDRCVAKASEHSSWELFYSNLEKSGRNMAELQESFLANTQRFQELSSRAKQTPDSKEIAEKILEDVETARRSALEQRDRLLKFADYAAYHAALKQKYLRASDRPWQSVEPDPPPPEPDARGLYWSERGEYSLALAAYKEGLADNPDDFLAFNNLAWLLATCPDASVRDGKR